jgi:hypothetical protein
VYDYPMQIRKLVLLSLVVSSTAFAAQRTPPISAITPGTERREVHFPVDGKSLYVALDPEASNLGLADVGASRGIGMAYFPGKFQAQSLNEAICKCPGNGRKLASVAQTGDAAAKPVSMLTIGTVTMTVNGAQQSMTVFNLIGGSSLNCLRPGTTLPAAGSEVSEFMDLVNQTGAGKYFHLQMK